MLIAFLTAACVLAVVLSALALGVGIVALTSVKAMEKSTHSIQYVPLDEAWSKEEKAMNAIVDKHRMQGNADDEIDDLSDLTEREGNIN